MDFTDEELRELSAFLARRLTPELRPVGTAEIPPEAHDAWEQVLMEARTAGRLAQIVRTASNVLPRDAYLREASALLDPPTRTESWLTGGVMVLAAALLVCISLAGFATAGVLAAIETAGPGTLVLAEETEQDRAPSPLPAADEVASAEVDPTPPDAATRAGDDGLDAGASLVAPERELAAAARASRVEDGPPEGPLKSEPETSEAGHPTPAVAAKVAAAPAPVTPETDDRICKTGGWIYTGTTAPGSIYVVPSAVHVRVSPPTKDNGWNPQTRTRCWLRKGDVIRLAEPPLAMPDGRHFWVHVAPVDGEVAQADTGR